MSVPDKFGSDLVRRRIVDEADFVVCRIGAWDEQFLVRECAGAAFFAAGVGLISWVAD